MRDFIAGFLDEFLTAAGAGDGDLAFSTGNPNGLAALGALEIAVLPVLQMVEEPQEFPILLIPGVGIPGEHPKQRPAHQEVIQKAQQQLRKARGNEGADEAQHQGRHQHGQAQLVGAVAACQKIAESGTQPVKKLSKHGYHLKDSFF